MFICTLAHIKEYIIIIINFISLIIYRDLGYAPVNTNYPKSTSYNQGISNMKIDDSEEEPCGSLGPSRPDYIPGRIIVQEKLFNENMELQTSGSKSCPT